MSVFDLNEQNSNLDSRIIAGLERLSHVFRTLLWQKAGEERLSPIQLRLLVFIRYHAPDMNNVSYLAREFNVTKPTISDAIKVLGIKGLVTKIADVSDNRRYHLQLTEKGQGVVTRTEDYTAPFTTWIAGVEQGNKEQVWQAIASLIRALNQSNMISVQRSCFSCRFYGIRDRAPFCNLLNEKLQAKDIRIDCPEYQNNFFS
ncbi:MAG TPA: MarR family winged helix-turn-helix transcriptional regulator [Anseongella sp.]